jgi:Tfp pilus assembly protein PilX
MVARSNERGVALIIALFMVLVLSLLGSSMMFISQSETWNSANYRTTSQARYAAESGVHRAANHLLNAYAPPTGAALADFNMTVSPVRRASNNEMAVLSSVPGVSANYPDAATAVAFAAGTQGALELSGVSATYTASAKLLSMQQYTNAYSGLPDTIQTWEINAIGEIPGPRASKVEVSAVVEQELIPLFRYAAFATHSGCAALSFAGGATTNSYDSSSYDPSVGVSSVVASYENTAGNVGTNGNLTEVGDPTTIHGTLSTPRSGVGQCTANNVTAQTVSGQATVTGGLIELPQSVSYPTPALATTPNELATGFSKNGTSCPANISGLPLGGCVQANGTGATLTPSSPTSVVMMGNVSVSSGGTLRLNAGTYVVNSMTLNGNATIEIGTGPVILQVAGQNQTVPIDFSGGGITNPSLDPSNFQITYGGTGTVKLTGNTQSAALVYAPNATSLFTGGSDYYGAVITRQLSATGGVALHYDRQLQRSMLIKSNPMMSAFTWKTY